MISTDPAALLAMLQHGDSFFPGGASAFSWGLETLCADAQIEDASDLAQFVEGQLACRWAGLDRAALVRAWHAGEDLDRAAAVDAEVDALSLALELREGSCRAGTALLTVHRKLGSTVAEAYLGRIRAASAHGHLCIAQGLVWRAAGLPEHSAQVLSAHTFCVGVLGAAIRLGRAGHIDAQRILQGSAGLIEDVIRTAPPDTLSSCTFAADIAVMRHERQTTRFFSN